MAAQDLWEFLIALDKSSVSVTPYEAKFIDNILQFNRKVYTPKQITVINKMISKYEGRVKW